MNGPASAAADRLAGAVLEVSTRLLVAAEERRRDEAEVTRWERELRLQTSPQASIGVRFAELLRTMRERAQAEMASAFPGLAEEFAAHEKALCIFVKPGTALARRFDQILDRRAERHDEAIEQERDGRRAALNAVDEAMAEHEYAFGIDRGTGVDVAVRLDRLIAAARAAGVRAVPIELDPPAPVAPVAPVSPEPDLADIPLGDDNDIPF